MSQVRASMYEAVIAKSDFAVWDVSALAQDCRIARAQHSRWKQPAQMEQPKSCQREKFASSEYRDNFKIVFSVLADICPSR